MGWKCAVCGLTLSNKWNLKQHIRDKHWKERPHKCHLCSYETSRKNNLTTHLKTHTDIRPFACTQCDKKYFNKHSLMKHMNKFHLQVQTFPCQKCSHVCYTKAGLSYHVLSKHQTEKHPKCPYCSYKTALKYDMKRHISIKHKNETGSAWRWVADYYRACFLSTTTHIHSLKLMRAGIFNLEM